MGQKIRTVLGDVRPKEITGALLHEHMLLTDSQKEFERARPAVTRRLTRDFRKLAAAGCNCFLDASLSSGPSCQPELAAEISARTGVHVVMSTGFYVERAIPPWVKRSRVSKIAEFMHRDLTAGVKVTGFPAGIIKVSSNAYGVEKNERKVFLAACEVHRHTGVPITVHSPKGAGPQLYLFVKNGVAPERVSFAHVEVGPWEDTLKAAKAGAVFVFTNWGGRQWVPEDAIVAQIADLVRRGHVRQITISVDMYLSWVKGRVRQRWPGGYVQIFDRVVPKLMKAGLKAGHIDTIIRGNPRRYLAF